MYLCVNINSPKGLAQSISFQLASEGCIFPRYWEKKFSDFALFVSRVTRTEGTWLISIHLSPAPLRYRADVCVTRQMFRTLTMKKAPLYGNKMITAKLIELVARLYAQARLFFLHVFLM